MRGGMTADIPENERSSLLTAEDVVAYLCGRANPKQVRAIEVARRDTNSVVSAWLDRIDLWSSDALPLTRDPETGLETRQTQSMERLSRLMDFVHGKRSAEIMTDGDVAQILAAGGLHEIEKFPKTPAQAVIAVSQMIRMIANLHPELAEEAARRGSDQAR